MDAAARDVSPWCGGGIQSLRRGLAAHSSGARHIAGTGHRFADAIDRAGVCLAGRRSRINSVSSGSRGDLHSGYRETSGSPDDSPSRERRWGCGGAGADGGRAARGLGIALLLVSDTERRLSSNYHDDLETRYAAAAGLERALGDLSGSRAELNGILAGAVRSTFEDGTTRPTLASGEWIDLTAITTELQTAMSASAAPGVNTPVWRLLIGACADVQPAGQVESGDIWRSGSPTTCRMWTGRPLRIAIASCRCTRRLRSGCQPPRGGGHDRARQRPAAHCLLAGRRLRKIRIRN